MIGILAAGLGSACTGSDRLASDVAPASTSTTTTTTTPRRASDGDLTIGVLLPTTGPAASIGQPILDGLRAEASRINAAGGVLGRPVRLVARDEGNSIATAALAVDSLLQEDDVDAIIGPLSSNTALGVIGRAVAGGVVSCSPSATAIALDGYPDNELFFRTIPSDTVLMGALVKEAQDTGKSTIAIIYIDDPYGRSLEDAVVTQARVAGLEVTETIGVSSSEESLAARILPAVGQSEMVVVLADTDTSKLILTTLDEIIGDGPGPDVFINDQIRLARSDPSIIDLSDDFRSRITGIAHRVVYGEAGSAQSPFVAHAIDCLGLIALAAEAVGSDQPLDFGQQMDAISTGGRSCDDFIDCKALIDDRLQIDFDGSTGMVTISGRNGDQTRGQFEAFGFDDTGTERLIGVFEHALR